MAKQKRQGTIEALLNEDRTFTPPSSFKSQANAKDAKIYKDAERSPEKFWEKHAGELHWFKKWKKVVDWKPPFVK